MIQKYEIVKATRKYILSQSYSFDLHLIRNYVFNEGDSHKIHLIYWNKEIQVHKSIVSQKKIDMKKVLLNFQKGEQKYSLKQKCVFLPRYFDK